MEQSPRPQQLTAAELGVLARVVAEGVNDGSILRAQRDLFLLGKLRPRTIVGGSVS